MAGAAELGSLYVSLGLRTQGLMVGMNAATRLLSKMSLGFFGGIGARASYALTNAFAGGIGGAMDFEKSMSRVKSLSGINASELAKLSAEAQKLGSTSAFSANEISVAMGNIAQAGFEKPTQILALMPNLLSLAAAGEIDLAEGATILTRTLNQFGFAAENSEAVVNRISQAANTSQTDVRGIGDALSYAAPAAVVAGKGFDETLAAITAMSDKIKDDQVGVYLRGVFSAMQKPSAESAALMKRLGLSFTDSAGRLKPMAQIVDEFQARLGNASNKAEVLEHIIGDARAGTAFAVLMQTGGQRLRELEQGFGSSGSAASVASERLDNVRGALQRVEGAAGTIAIAIFEGFAGQGKTGLLDFAGALQSLRPIAIQVGQAIGSTIQWVASTVQMVSFGVQNFGLVWDWLSTSAALQLVKIGGAISYWLGTVPISIFSQMWTAATTYFKNIGDYVGTVFANLGNNIKNNWAAILKFIAGGGMGKLEMNWTPLTEGVQRVGVEALKLPPQVASNLEVALGEQLQELSGTVASKFKEFEDKKLTELAAPPALTDNTLPPTEIATGKKIGLDTKRSEGATDRGAKEFGSLEALRSIEARVAGATKEEKQLVLTREHIKVSKQMAEMLKKFHGYEPDKVVRF